MSNDIIFVALIVVSILGILVIPRWLTLRAIPAVISLFRIAGAVGIENARSAEELGLGRKGFFSRGLSTRDYRPRALKALLSGGIVQLDSDGKFYLVEEKLALTKWAHL